MWFVKKMTLKGFQFFVASFIILFVTFAAFLQASKAGDYFNDFALALVGRARGDEGELLGARVGTTHLLAPTSLGAVDSVR